MGQNEDRLCAIRLAQTGEVAVNNGDVLGLEFISVVVPVLRPEGIDDIVRGAVSLADAFDFLRGGLGSRVVVARVKLVVAGAEHSRIDLLVRHCRVHD